MGNLMKEENVVPTIEKLYVNSSENKDRSTYVNYLPCCITHLHTCTNVNLHSPPFPHAEYAVCCDSQPLGSQFISYVMQIHARSRGAIDISQSFNWELDAVSAENAERRQAVLG